MKDQRNNRTIEIEHREENLSEIKTEKVFYSFKENVISFKVKVDTQVSKETQKKDKELLKLW